MSSSHAAVTPKHIFSDQQTYVEAALRATRSRLSAALDATKGDDNCEPAARVAGDVALHDVARGCATDGIFMPVLWLRDRLQLTATEEIVIWTLLAHELDPPSRRLMRELNTEDAADATLDAIRRAVYGGRPSAAAGAELAAEGTLRRFGLIERTDGDDRCPDHRQTYAVSHRVLALVLGNAEIDPCLAGIVSSPTQETASARVVVPIETQTRIDQALRMALALVLVTGPVGTGRRSSLVAAANKRAVAVMQIDCRLIASTRESSQCQLRAIARECRLLRKIPLLCHLDALTGAGDVPNRVDLVETELAGLVLGTAARPISRRWRRPPTLISMPVPTSTARAQLWARAVPHASKGDTEIMATMYPLAPALIIAAGEVAARQAAGGSMTADHVSTGVRSILDDRLAGLATRITVSQTWDDMVLPGEQMTAVIELLARIRQRSLVYETWGFADKLGKGLGVSALLSGPPGTGKTMAAGLVAKELGVELYQVDLSKIASKWIGETERNLANLFDAAEAGHAVLLFDEADALFGKRTEVKSSNDRHANQEVNFLLQRLESFTGVCLLTTNHEAAIDEAFRRRLTVHVRFAVPDVEERRKLWRAMLPPSAPLAPDLSFDTLAEDFAMTGGYIRNAVPRAAFLAADTTGVIDGQLLTRAAQLEYEAMGKIVSSRF